MPVATPLTLRYADPMQNHAQRIYLRPIPCDPERPNARPLAGGPLAFAEIEILRRDQPAEIVPVDAVDVIHPGETDTVAMLSAPRTGVLGLDPGRTLIMGVVNVTPDSFSDGGLFADATAAVAHGLALVEAGADILDVGGESTRPGAEPVSVDEELRRVMPVIEGLRAAGCNAPISVDTRKAAVAEAALTGGATMINDVSALSYDDASLGVALRADAVCLMHAQGDPRTMQQNPQYADVLLDVYDYLETRVLAAEKAGIPRGRLLVDPGIGFGKTLMHNLALLRRLSLFHAIGVPVLLGVSRKRFIGALAGVGEPRERMPGSIAAGLAGVAQGVQVLRVHDVAETRQALAVWQAIVCGHGDRGVAQA